MSVNKYVAHFFMLKRLENGDNYLQTFARRLAYKKKPARLNQMSRLLQFDYLLVCFFFLAAKIKTIKRIFGMF